MNYFHALICDDAFQMFINISSADQENLGEYKAVVRGELRKPQSNYGKTQIPEICLQRNNQKNCRFC